MQLFPRHYVPTIRSRLVMLVLGCALPILFGYLAFAHDAARRERAHVAQDALTVAAALSAAVDRDLASAETAARVLANSPELRHGDLAAFHDSARRLLRPDFPVYAFELSDAAGVAVLSSRYPYGANVPANGNEAQVRAVFASGEATTTGLHRADPSQPFVVSVEMPVWKDGKVAWVLSVQLRPHRLAELMAAQHLPPGWIAEVFDNHRQLVERNLDLTAHLGEPMPAALATRVAGADSGIVAPLDGGGWTAYARSPARGWTVAVNFPDSAARDLLGHSRPAVGASVLALLALSLGLAWRIGGSIAHAVRALTGPAAALGRGAPLAIPDLPLREAAAVAGALRQVEGELLGYRNRLEALVEERTVAMERSAALLETVYATAPVGLCFLDRDLRFVMVNDYLAAINGVPAADHIGRTLPEVLGAAGEQIEQDYRRVLAAGRPVLDVESSAPAPSAPGEMRHWIASFYPVYGPQRELTGINAVVLDATERKLLEQRTRDNDELFRALYEASSDAHMLADFSFGSNFVSANQAAARMFGCASTAEFLDLSPVSVSPEFQPGGRRSEDMAAELIAAALETGSAHFEWLLVRRDGSTFHADIVLTSVALGGKNMLQATVRDISARVAAGAALRATGARLEERERFIRTVTDHLPALVAYWDSGRRLRFANRPYLQWLGCSGGDALGRTAEDLLGRPRMDLVEPRVEAVLAGQPQGFARELRMPAGDVLHAWASYIPDFDEQGAVRGFYMLMADITDLKHTEARLVQALREAEQASRAKGEFLANMSHEIRTPMNAILGLARLLDESSLGQRERGYVTRMQTAAHSLLAMLSDVLDFSRIESGQLLLERTAFRLDEVLDSIAVLAVPNAWAKGIEPVFAVAPGVPAALEGDPMRLQQVLLNLVGNAVKFTERGEVVLAIGLARQEAGSATLSFSVRDTGIGIAPEQQKVMFDAFTQGDSSTSRKYGGAGLGLSIARRLVGLMGGELRVHSAPGQGAEFSFELTFPAGPAAPEAAAPGLTVLVADDNESACAALAAACAGLGWQVTRAHGGAEALARLKGKRRHDLAFLDAAMPDLDGATVIRYARSAGMAHLPRCVLLAPDLDQLDARDAAEAALVLAKPFTPRALREAAAALLGSPAPASARGAGMQARLQGLCVLLVEDNVINQEVASHVLRHAGARLDIAGDGRAAVALLAEGRRYDLVLMDVQMPVMNGFEATAAIRAMGLRELPIVAMTANAMEDDRRQALAAGMDAHLAKPIDVDELLATLARLTGRPDAAPALASHAAASPAAHVPSAASTAAAAPAGIAPAAIAGIDLPAALARFNGNFEGLASVLRQLPASQGGAVDEVRALFARGERGAAQQALHRLRGVAANLGASEVAAVALTAERALERGEAPPLARLEDALRVVLAAAGALPPPAPAAGAHAAPAGRADLERLLESLLQNKLKAAAQFEALRPALETVLAPQQARGLAGAIAALRFDEAARMVRALLDRKDEA